MNESTYWQAVLQRDRRYDGAFVYAVRSTGIYCRPSCSSRRPKSGNVSFFPLPEVAEQAGFRPCKRCRPDQAVAGDPRAELVRRICRYIENHLEDPLTLESLGRHFGLSPSHLQRMFKSVVAISPQQYTEACRMRHIKTALRKGDDIMGALHDAGYSSTSRLYGKASAHLGMTPGAYKQGGRNVPLLYTTAQCPLGYLLVAATDKGICAVRIGSDEAELQEAFLREFCGAHIERDTASLAGWVREIVEHLNGEQPRLTLPLDVRATAFQRRVWQALQEIPYGSTRTYTEIAKVIGQPSAARAVARACATNPAALLIPCHRVLRNDGGLGGFRWGIERKKALLRREGLSGSPDDQDKS
ncbi:MAG: bifunctional DNA-binding transcriptional regulator/O6-methylguanine-DNA methyltransferase Ada [Alphaproteobacteria bacterium]|uniref:methylated-DNA--[protein]-cysteine S-methyltransferase n=1 Tax=Candidatus Nitrobium versatile TaxID=2884831 RepID=A0A953M180_9BACT|nr:bifunctional DNA-binding transcriptional regulator/O6-methylguanine-DNA methyltransferase Ada [Candidatus Nitrobium versatile]